MDDGRTTSAPETAPGGEGAAHLLSNGHYAALVTPWGSGYSALDGYALTRWTADPTQDADGFFLYVRDLNTSAVWSAGYQPVRRGPAHYTAQVADGCVEIVRVDDNIETRTRIAVAAQHNAEIRRVTLANRGDDTRVLELTSYAEVVLNTPAADAGHPAFSKLFVQTAYLTEQQALLAWRRLRSPDDRPLWLVHRLDVQGGSGGELAYETDRLRFLGRGRTLADPQALDPGARLTGTTGNVLDPVLALRRVVALAPGDFIQLTMALGAAETREAVEALSMRLRDPAALQHAAVTPVQAKKALGVPGAWLRGVRLTTHPEGVHSPGSDLAAPAAVQSSELAAPAASEPLLFFNGWGGFSQDGREYVIRLSPGEDGRPKLPPLPWTNVVANEVAGFIVSERGAGYTWAGNSRENRITPWANDPVSDPHGEALYLRDEATGEVWSPLPGPAPAAAPYEVRHGFGYTRYLHSSFGLEQEVVLFLPRSDSERPAPVKIARVRITNAGNATRRIALYSYAHLVLGGLPQETRGLVATRLDPETGSVLATNPARGEFSGRVAFAAPVVPKGADPISFTTDREAFLGRFGSSEAPAAVRKGALLDGRTGEGLDPCVAFRVPLEVKPGETTEVAFLLGEGWSEAEARTVVKRYRNLAEITQALGAVREFWTKVVSGVQIETPSPGIDLMVNGWLTYQNLVCRVWARSAFYQSGGAFGFRDQLQDSSALVYLMPELTRAQIVLHATHQFVEGDVLHWWHPPASKGIRTRFSDDLLWLPYITAFYLQVTGETSVLNEPARFLTAPALESGEDELFLIPTDSVERADVYEHCCRAIDRSLTAGMHGLPLMGTGDWNDGMNRVGREGKGESVWLGFFLYQILTDFLPFCEQRGDTERIERYRAYQNRLREALNTTGWDGEWYRRAFYDNGAPLGSRESDECQIDVIAQAWSVLSGAAPAKRAAMALDALEQHLVSEEDGIIRLLTPAFDQTPHDPGYIKGYLPGVRENGGQYTHGALWAVRALAQFGRADRAAELLEMLSPVGHCRTPEAVAVYQVEPYVIAADVYGEPPHVGRGGWTWYTGSAGWMFRVALESVLGVELRGGHTLALHPALPPSWPGFTLRYRVPGSDAVYELAIRRGDGMETSALLNGELLPLEGDTVLVPLTRDSGSHRVEVAFGRDARVWYAMK